MTTNGPFEANVITDHFDRLEGEGQFERAAAIAIFNLQMRRGIQAMSRGAATRTAGTK